MGTGQDNRGRKAGPEPENQPTAPEDRDAQDKHKLARGDIERVPGAALWL